MKTEHDRIRKENKLREVVNFYGKVIKNLNDNYLRFEPYADRK